MKLLAPLASLLATTAAVELSTVYQFPNGTWLENIAQLHNSSLLTTLIGTADIYLMDRNVFAVAVGNVTSSNAPVEGTFGVWSLDFRTPDATKHSAACIDSGVKIRRIADLPHAGLLNGMAFRKPSTLFLADSWAGHIIQLDAVSGTVTGAIEDASLMPDFASPGLVIGVNGLRIHGGHLYFSNTVQNLLGRIALGQHDNATAHGGIEVIKRGEEISQPDDFAVLRDGSVLLARPLADTLQRVSLGGEVSEIARGGVVSGGTSVLLGRDGEVFVSTSGLEGGARVGGGRIVRVEI
ncbi:hypothetical protein DE146DRAFT_718468 [Phaeosphaeria sp. MPI-PUGE-AT-0046c]|nr:hypothetical protein DE146DRAFT_718468 [Phaeosphaeria sp. MPI-PUGE-AT-0046c]